MNVLDHPDATKSKPRVKASAANENDQFLQLSPESAATHGDKIMINTGNFGSESKEENKAAGEEIEELETRTILPFLRDPNNRPSVFKILKDAIGKDLSRFCVPVYFNEPVSMVQKVAEIMQYENLLVSANLETTSSLIRMLYVASFAIAQYKCTYRRMNKPFNPILGETFELVTPTFKYIGEQVSHHPPISAAHAISKHYEFSMDTSTKMGFNGTYLKATPTGTSMI